MVADYLLKKGGRVIKIQNNNNINNDEQIITRTTSGTDEVLGLGGSRKPRQSKGTVQPKVRKARGTK
jgi:hypothetical protein